LGDRNSVFALHCQTREPEDTLDNRVGLPRYRRSPGS